jgi:O-antigen/teichoic acid export membrane protein/O-antigen ligase
LLLAQGTTAVVALLANILASRSLLADGRGELALLLQLAYLGTLGVSLGTDRSIVAVYGGLPVHEIVRAQVRLLVRPALVALCLGLLSEIALPLLGLGAWRVAGIMVSLFVVANAFVRASRAVAIAGNRQRDFVVATIAEQVLLLATLAGLALAGVYAVVVWVAAYMLTCIGPVVFYLVRWARSGPRSESDDTLRRRAARREGMQLVPSSLANSGMLRVDRLFLAAMTSTAALGHYAAVSTFTELLTWPLLAFADNRTGIWRRRHDAGTLRSRTILLGAATFVAAGAVVTATLTRFMVPLLGPGFGVVTTLILPLVAAAGVLGLSQVVMALLVARRRNAWASVSDTGGFVISLIAYVALIPGHGAAGAAWGSLIGYGGALAIGTTALLAPGRVGVAAVWRPRRTSTRTPAAGALTGPSRRAAPGRDRMGGGALAGFALMLVAIAGRYTLDRAGVAALAWVDLRVVGLLVGCGLVAVELRTCGGLKGYQSAGWLVATMIFFGYQTLSIGWAPPGADIAAGAVDLLCLAVLVFAVYLHARTWPQSAGWRVLWLFWVAGVVFALGAFLVTGPGEQGRYAAFGGGPNVFVRIEVLALIAAIALIAHGASRHLLWSVPLLLAGALASGSRGGLVAAAVVGAVAVLAGRRRARRAAGLAVVGTLGALFAVVQLNLPGADLIRSRFVEQTLQEGYASDRPVVYASAVDLAREHPLLGVGIDGWRVLVGDQFGIVYPHNYVLSVAAEGGTVGLVLLGIAMALWLRTMRAARPWSLLTKTLVAAAAFVAIASMVSGDYYDSRLAWCCAALAAASTVTGPTTGPEPAGGPRTQVASRTGGRR